MGAQLITDFDLAAGRGLPQRRGDFTERPVYRRHPRARGVLDVSDGADNPKNTRSLVQTHRADPSMALEVRTNAEAAVRAGLHHILFTEQPETVPAAIENWLRSLELVPSPQLMNGRLSEAVRRGEYDQQPPESCAQFWAS